MGGWLGAVVALSTMIHWESSSGEEVNSVHREPVHETPVDSVSLFNH